MGEKVEAVVMISVMFIGYVVAGLTIGHVHGAESGKEELRQEAVHAGVARWVCDPVTGKTEFEWLKPATK
jgi:hypothetical protein